MYCACAQLGRGLAALSLLGVVVFRYRSPMGEPGGVIETESPGRLGCHHSNMKQDDEALALLASLPFIFFHLSNPSAYWGDAGKQNRAYI